MKKEVWVIDDEQGILDVLRDILEDEGYDVETFLKGKKALEAIKLKSPSVILLDLWLKDIDGFEVLKQVKKFLPSIPVIIISGHGTIETAVKAIKMGAFDFLEKPLSYERVVITVENAIRFFQLSEENKRLREKYFGNIQLTGVSSAIQRLKELITRVAPTDTTVLILGESGVGKELVAKLIHFHSLRAANAFVDVNCAAIPDTLIEAELFGYEKGAFTGAEQPKKGKLEMAHKGTLFLDEIGDMSLEAQAKILRVLQEKRFERLGGTKTIEVDVRIIAATNKDLTQEIKKGKFREDLYYRLNVFPIEVPPLRERKEDIPYLVEEFLEEISYRTGLGKKEISQGVIEVLMDYDWPGNIRELKNFVERLVIISTKDVIEVSDLPKDFMEKLRRKSFSEEPLCFKEQDYKRAKLLFEKEFLKRKLMENQGNISKTARAIGIERAYLQKKIKELGIKKELN